MIGVRHRTKNRTVSDTLRVDATAFTSLAHFFIR